MGILPTGLLIGGASDGSTIENNITVIAEDIVIYVEPDEEILVEVPETE